jgi:hypothetical protein
MMNNFNPANTATTFSPADPTAGARVELYNRTVLGTGYTVTSTNGGCTSVASASRLRMVHDCPDVPSLNTTAQLYCDGFDDY